MKISLNLEYQKFIVKYIISNKEKWIKLFIILVIYVTLQLLPSLAVKKYIDYSTTNRELSNLIIVAVLYCLISILIYGFSIFTTNTSEDLGWNITNQLREDLMKKILQFDEKFFNNHSVGELIERIDKDVSLLLRFISNTLIQIIINLFTLIGILIVFYINSIWIGIIFSIYITLSLYLIFIVQDKKKDILYEEREYSTKIISDFSEWVHARKDINTLSKVEYIVSKIDKLFKEWLPLKVAGQKYLYRVWISTLITLATANALALLIGGKLLFNGIISIGTVYLLFSYSNLLKKPMEDIQLQIQMILSARANIKRLSTLISYKTSIIDGMLELPNQNLSVTFENVSYAYDSAEVLRDINLNIDASQTVGILGISGSGKSTLCKIICKMLNPSKGRVLLGNIDLSSISISSVRENIAYVSANGQIFNSTIRNNLTLFNDSISDEEILEVLDKFNITPLFKKYESNDNRNFLDVLITDNDLSSGEKQIISLTRLCFKKLKVIILDEASSRIDSKIEDLFYKILNNMIDRCTVIIVAHELKSTEICDRIVIFEDGKIIESGLRETLVNNINSRYYTLLNG